MPTPEDLFRQCVELAPDFTVFSSLTGVIDARWSVDGLPFQLFANTKEFALEGLLEHCLGAMRGYRDRATLAVRKPLGERSPAELLAEIDRADAKRKSLRKEARESITAAEAALQKVRDAADPLWREAERLDALVESRLLALAKRYPNDAQKAGLGVVAMLCAKEADKWEIEDGNDLAILLAG